MVTSVTGALSVIISLANQAYISLIAIIWYYVIHFGLSPSYAYPTDIQNNTGFMSFYDALFSRVYVSVGGLIILIASFSLVASNSIGRLQIPSTLLYRIIFALSLSFFSFQICMLILRVFESLFLEMWDYGTVNWLSLFSVTGTVSQLKDSYHTSPYFEVMKFLLLTVYFTGTGALLAVLEIRQALTIFLIITLPLFSLFFVMKGLDDWAVKFWKMFVELSVLPFFVLIILYNVHFFHQDFLLQAAFILLAASSPYLLVTGGSILSSGASGKLSNAGLFNSEISSPIGAAGVVGKHFSSSPGGSLSSFVSNRRFGKNLPVRGGRGLDFSNYENSDLGYRRFGGDDE